jgi:hypothetical protein
MVIGKRFVWAHLPKTGGDATAAMLATVPGLVEFADPPESEEKHLPLFAEGREIAGKLIVMNIRRLPGWALSAAHHEAQFGVYPDYRPGLLETPDEITSKSDADGLLRWMTDQGRIEVDRWLRTESLEQDVVALLDELGVLTPEIEARVRAVGRVNVGMYSRTAPFTDAQIRRLYERNPMWAAIERRVYPSS